LNKNRDGFSWPAAQRHMMLPSALSIIELVDGIIICETNLGYLAGLLLLNSFLNDSLTPGTDLAE